MNLPRLSGWLLANGFKHASGWVFHLQIWMRRLQRRAMQAEFRKAFGHYHAPEKREQSKGRAHVG